MDGFCERENPSRKWMMTGGSPVSGNLHSYGKLEHLYGKDRHGILVKLHVKIYGKSMGFEHPWTDLNI